MNVSTLFQSTRRWLLTLVVATILAATAAYAPVVVDNLAGTAMVTSAYACQGSTSHC